tara:strand:- start:118 stop:405 length:288 start_codon:yes stop_codon:yes gene_type:complete
VAWGAALGWVRRTSSFSSSYHQERSLVPRRRFASSTPLLYTRVGLLPSASVDMALIGSTAVEMVSIAVHDAWAFGQVTAVAQVRYAVVETKVVSD